MASSSATGLAIPHWWPRSTTSKPPRPTCSALPKALHERCKIKRSNPPQLLASLRKRRRKSLLIAVLCEKTRRCAKVRIENEYAPRDSNLPAETQGKRENSGETAQNTSHFAVEWPPELVRVIDAWPKLPAHIKAAVLALVDGHRV
jgi:hypothetical protein